MYLAMNVNRAVPAFNGSSCCEDPEGLSSSKGYSIMKSGGM